MFAHFLSQEEPPIKKQKLDDSAPGNTNESNNSQSQSQKAPEEDEEEDILKSGWLYIDSSGNRQVLLFSFLSTFAYPFYWLYLF